VGDDRDVRIRSRCSSGSDEDGDAVPKDEIPLGFCGSLWMEDTYGAWMRNRGYVWVWEDVGNELYFE